MSTVLGERSLAGVARGRWKLWLVILAGLLVLYVPTYLELARTLWREDEYAQGPIILAVFGYLVWRNRAVLLEDSQRSLIPGAIVFMAGRLVSFVWRVPAFSTRLVLSPL